MDDYEFDGNNFTGVLSCNQGLDGVLGTQDDVDCYYKLTHDNIANRDEYGFELFIMTRPMKSWDLKFREI